MRRFLAIGFVTFLVSIAAHSDDLGCKTTYSEQEYIRNRVDVTKLNSSNWKTLKFDQLGLISTTQVPLQDGNYLYRVSCGPIGVALAYEMLSRSPSHRDAKDWSLFILGFSYFSGGVFPHILVEHANANRRNHDPIMEHIKISQYSRALETIKSQINQNKPVMALLVHCAMSQHNVNIVGYNDTRRQILILDPDGSFKIESYLWLEKIMYAGVLEDEGDGYLAQSQIAVPYFRQFTDFDFYNLFVFHDSLKTP